MPTVPYTVLVDSQFAGRRFMLVQWPSMANGEDGQPVDLPLHSDRSVQVVGTFGAGGNCAIEGSLDGSNYALLNDPQGNVLNITTAKIEQVLEVCRLVRPRISAGDGTTALTVTMLMVQGG